MDAVVGLYGEAAPKSVETFLGLAAGSLPGLPSYAGSSVSKIVQGRYIECGKPAAGDAKLVERSIDTYGMVRKEYVDLGSELVNDDSNSLSHDKAGLISVPRGGGAFEFWMMPAPDPNLDRERLVIGEVLEGGAEVIAALDALPTRKPSAQSELSGLASLYGLKAGVGLGVVGVIGRVPGLRGLGNVGFNMGRGALGLGAAALIGGEDPRIRARELNDRPLSKVRLARVKVL